MLKIFRGLVYQMIAGPLVIMVVFSGCTVIPDKSEQAIFEKISPEASNINFSNDLIFSDSLNVFTYSDFYAGGGVALGDINNDGLLDIYLVANQKSNKLYLNKGNFEFEDITDKAGVGGIKPWSTGVSMADVNGDGLLDIYVTNSAVSKGEERKNELFINNGDLTFTEQAELFGIADSGYSIHASFFDYNKDGNLDMYLLNNHNSKPIGSYDLQHNQREERSFKGGDRLFLNDGNRFLDVTKEAGIYSSEIGFGLGVSVGDLNRDGWMDIYISNDFFERDYLYMNNGDGTFREVLEEKFNSISTTSMGSDIADLDNDGFPELFVTDMLPESEERLKKITAFIGWEQYRAEVDMGYHQKFTRNTLHYNNTDGTYSEIGRYAGVEATDWSWGALMADFNLDGRRDIFVANGIYKDETDKDFFVATTRKDVMEKIVKNNRVDNEELLKLMPTTAVSNYIFENQGNMRFINRASEWGVDEPGFSNGSAYGDLNGDGALDLVVNNVNMEAFIYRNRAGDLYPDRNWLQVELKGESPNALGVGAQVELIADGRRWYVEQMPQRGFQSSMDPTLHVGLGTEVVTLDTLQVHWPDGRVSLQTEVKTRQRLVIQQAEAVDTIELKLPLKKEKNEDLILKDVTNEIDLNWQHQESSYNDFKQFPLSFHMRSTEGPPICIGDINGDGWEDFYVGGARGQPGALYMQQNEGRFIHTNQSALELDREAEDTDCIFFDANGDGLPELFVASGSSEFPTGSEFLADRLYRFGSDGILVLSENALPRPQDGYKPTGVVTAGDMDGDGHIDLFVGNRMNQLAYGVPVGGHLLKNDGNGRFEDVTEELASDLLAEELAAAGITAAAWGDLNGNGWEDLVVAGEWMPLTVFYNRQGRMERADLRETGLDSTSGWWQSLILSDLNGDGTLDLVAGNHGLNSRFRASSEEPVHMWAGDFNHNGMTDQIFAAYNSDGGPYPLALLHDILYNLPYLKSRYSSYADYAGQKITDVFTQKQLDDAVHYQAEQLASVVGWNNGDGSFQIQPLPFHAQLTPIYAILPQDLDNDGIPELLMGGNLQEVRPQSGPYDASYGILLRQDSTGNYIDVPSKESGFSVQGDIRSIKSIVHDGKYLILIARKNKPIQIFTYNNNDDLSASAP